MWAKPCGVHGKDVEALGVVEEVMVIVTMRSSVGYCGDFYEALW